MTYLKEKHFTSRFAQFFLFQFQRTSLLKWFSFYQMCFPFHAWLVYVSIIVSSDERSRSFMVWVLSAVKICLPTFQYLQHDVVPLEK